MAIIILFLYKILKFSIFFKRNHIFLFSLIDSALYKIISLEDILTSN